MSEGRKARLLLVDFLLLLIINWGEKVLKGHLSLTAKKKDYGSAFCFIGTQGVKKTWLGITVQRAGQSLGLMKEKEMTRDDHAGELASFPNQPIDVYPVPFSPLKNAPTELYSESPCWSGYGIWESSN